MATPFRVNDDGELEKQCGVCEEWWPATLEFFTRSRATLNVVSPCRACMRDTRDRISRKLCNVEGCCQPRYNGGTTFCREHHYQIRLNQPPPAKPYRPYRRRVNV